MYHMAVRNGVALSAAALLTRKAAPRQIADESGYDPIAK